MMTAWSDSSMLTTHPRVIGSSLVLLVIDSSKLVKLHYLTVTVQFSRDVTVNLIIHFALMHFVSCWVTLPPTPNLGPEVWGANMLVQLG